MDESETLKPKFLAIIDQKHLSTKYILSFCHVLSLFSKILWLHWVVTPSISLQNKHRINARMP